jgi:hypothetical protein
VVAGLFAVGVATKPLPSVVGVPASAVLVGAEPTVVVAVPGELAAGLPKKLLAEGAEVAGVSAGLLAAGALVLPPPKIPLAAGVDAGVPNKPPAAGLEAFPPPNDKPPAAGVELAGVVAGVPH